MDTEYESVVCAALLHDIGKFYQRFQSARVSHWELSAAFIENCRSSFSDADLVKALVGHHHESAITPASDRPDAITDQRQRLLAYLVSRADNFSSKERPESARTEGYQVRAPLGTVFAQVDLARGQAPDPGAFGYRLGALFRAECYPDKLGEDYRHPESDYERQGDEFLSDFRRLFADPYPRMCDTLVHLLQNYLWCVPSDTTRELRDISLADHLKVAGSLAACFYKYHESSGWDEPDVKDDAVSRVALVCGDLSGIQDYIYGIASIGEGGVAKRLRGRSFRISALTEAVALRILHALDLPIACKVMSTGGQFYLLVPNTAEAARTLEAVRASVSEWLLEAHSGDLAVSIVSYPLTGDQLQQGRFDEALDEVHALMSRAKLRKFQNVIGQGPRVFEMQFRGRSACPVCDRRPAGTPGEEPQPCDDCELDEAVGRKLASAKWMVIGEHPASESVAFFSQPGWHACLVKSAEEAARLKPVMAYNLRDGDLIPGTPSGYAMYAGYVPRWSGVEDYEQARKRFGELARQEEHTEASLRSGEAIKSFTALAAQSQGARLIGVLRADVDHLGLVFSLGMRGKASISRIASLSGSLNTFFTHVLVRLIAGEFPDTYVAYSGGDDLMVVGPWSSTLDLAHRISQEFARYTAFNPNLTLSAGIGTYRPRVPIATTSVRTGAILEQSKESGRNSLTVFQTTVAWDRYPVLAQWANALAESIESGDMSKGFLYRLLIYQRLAQLFHDGGDVRAVLFRPHLAYDIGRNLTDEQGRPKIAPELHAMLIDLLGAGAADTWRMLKAPVTWSSYLTRKEG